MKKSIVIAAVVLLTATGALYLRSVRGAGEQQVYEFADVVRGDIENVVTCTGSLSAVGTVEIGTQVSGTVAEVLVDFNDEVRAGEVLAVLDTTMLKASVMDARAGLLSARAQYELAVAEHEQNLPLIDKGYISEKEFLPLEYAVRTREAQVMSSEAMLRRAEANLGYAVIRSPIDGTVIQRTVEPGQTVAASLQTPTLFIIAEDLSEMEIHAAVDESDIGRIETGMEVRFTVQAYPDETFDGVVSQIRLQPETIQNVVNYTVVVDASNDRGLLLPGMTATVDFVIEHRENVLLVPNSALRLTPSEAMIAAARRQIAERRGASRGPVGETGGQDAAGPPEQEVSPGTMPLNPQRSDAERATPGSDAGRAPLGSDDDPAFRPPGSGPDRADPGRKVIWYMDEAGEIAVEPVRVGATDGKNTELVSSRTITEGTRIIKSLTGTDGGGAVNAAAGQRDRPPGFRLF